MEWKRISAVLAAAALAVAGCSSSGGGNGGTNGPTGGGGGGGPVQSGEPDPGGQPASKIKAASMSGDCADYGKYGKYNGAKVTVYTSITDPEISYHRDSVKDFERCTGITVQYQPSKEFEDALKTKVEAGNPPDIALFPQPGLLQTFARSGNLKLA